jgi:hypothetical protein
MVNIGNNGFDATHVDPSVDFEHVPAARYNAEITDSDIRDNSKGTGEYLRLEFTILDGPCAGRKLWTQLNLVNPLTQAVEIAQRELSAICHATGKLQVQDSIDLHNIPLEINVKVKTSPEYGPQNIIRGYTAIKTNGNRPTIQAPVKSSAPAKAQSSPQTGGGTITPPWKQK